MVGFRVTCYIYEKKECVNNTVVWSTSNGPFYDFDTLKGQLIKKRVKNGSNQSWLKSQNDTQQWSHQDFRSNLAQMYTMKINWILGFNIEGKKKKGKNAKKKLHPVLNANNLK